MGNNPISLIDPDGKDPLTGALLGEQLWDELSGDNLTDDPKSIGSLVQGTITAAGLGALYEAGAAYFAGDYLGSVFWSEVGGAVFGAEGSGSEAGVFDFEKSSEFELGGFSFRSNIGSLNEGEPLRELTYHEIVSQKPSPSALLDLQTELNAEVGLVYESTNGNGLGKWHIFSTGEKYTLSFRYFLNDPKYKFIAHTHPEFDFFPSQPDVSLIKRVGAGIDYMLSSDFIKVGSGFDGNKQVGSLIYFEGGITQFNYGRINLSGKTSPQFFKVKCDNGWYFKAKSEMDLQLEIMSRIQNKQDSPWDPSSKK